MHLPLLKINKLETNVCRKNYLNVVVVVAVSRGNFVRTTRAHTYEKHLHNTNAQPIRMVVNKVFHFYNNALQQTCKLYMIGKSITFPYL